MLDPAHHVLDTHLIAEDVESGDSTVGFVTGELAAVVGKDALRLPEALDDLDHQRYCDIGRGGISHLEAEDRT